MDQDRKFAEMNGLCWHEEEYKVDDSDGWMWWICKKCGNKAKAEGSDNPDFSDPREVLKVVMEGDDGNDFIRSLGNWTGSFEEFYDHGRPIPVEYITTPGKLRDAWISWKEAQK
jgi:hypothetical protein